MVGVPDSFIIKINGQQYQQNKCDITFSLSKGNDGVVEGVTGSQHAKEQDGTENRTDRFSNVMQSEIYMYVQVAQCRIDVC